MEYKILESNGVENENIDGAGFNNFCAGNSDLIIKGILNECDVFLSGSNSITINTGELLIKGIRIKITKEYVYTFTATPSVETKYELIAQIVLSQDRSISFEVLCRTPQALRQDALYKTEQGVYECVIATFSHSRIGIISIEKKLKVETSKLVVDDSLSLTSKNPVQNKVINKALNNRVAKVSGKGLSTNDYTNADRDKLTSMKTETWAFELENGTTVTKNVVVV